MEQAEAPRFHGARNGLLLPIVIFALLAAVPLAGSLMGSNYITPSGSRIMIFAIAALSLDLLIGFAGLVSFGHAAFLGIGAYAVGILAAHGHDESLLALPVAILASCLFATLTGAVMLRTKGVYFIMISLAFGQMAFYVASSLSTYGGDDGLTLPGRDLVIGSPLLRDETHFFYAVLILLLVCYGLMRRIAGSRFGRVLQGLKQNPARMEALGFSGYRFRLAAYVIAGGVCGISGFLLANSSEFVSPAYMTWQRSGELIVMTIIGGVGSLEGAILGAIAFLMLEEWLSSYTEHWKILLGPLLVLLAIFARRGLTGLIGRARHG